MIDTVHKLLKVVIRNHGLLDEAALDWLSSIDTAGLTDRQRLGLAFLHRNGALTNQQYRSLTGCIDALAATRELTGMATRGLVEKTSVTAAGPSGTSPVGNNSKPGRHFDFEPTTVRAGRRDRRTEIRHLLARGPMSSRGLSTSWV